MASNQEDTEKASEEVEVLPEIGEKAPSEEMAIIKEETSVSQQVIPFMDNNLAAALTNTGNIYVSLPGVCTALGLDATAQIRRIQRRRVLARGLRLIPIETRGGVQRINCLRVDLIALWLAGVQTKGMKPDVAEKIEAYQEELAPIATQTFFRSLGLNSQTLVNARPNAPDEMLQTLAQEIDNISDATNFMREHFQALSATTGKIPGISAQLEQVVHLLELLTEQQSQTIARQQQAETTITQIEERTRGLTPAHQRQVQDFVDHMVKTTKNRPNALSYYKIYGRLKQRFQVGSYSDIADSLFIEVMQYLKDELDHFTGDEQPQQGTLF